ncbi:MAG: hypothetical protein M3Z64_05585, partial [Verrucomicrobiota bacterium]|nr:hypothetical protein [Verrucomicrobiota bacterium]
MRRLLLVGLLLCASRLADGATIVVTTTRQGVQAAGVDGTCSLQEAIYSANYDDNVAPYPPSPTQFIVTGCNKGNGNDTIILQSGATYQMTAPAVDPANPLGPTGAPLIFSNIVIEANGATIVGLGSGSNLRAFAVGNATVDLSEIDPGRVVFGTGELTLNSAYLKNFSVKGGSGTDGGGGGMGAGGAIYLKGGELTIVNSTFEANSAIGGNAIGGAGGAGGGGGGLSGNGGHQAGGSQGTLAN